MEQNTLILVLLFFLISVFYSSAGFGGGSSYLAVLAITSLAFPVIRSTALICNIVVVSGNILLQSRHAYMPWKRAVPLVAMSIPLAFLGGQWPIKSHVFYLLLGITLLAAAFVMFVQTYQKEPLEGKQLSSAFSGLIGGGIGFLSGLVGIGGGIFLAPMLHFLKWDNAKKIAATASLFILANSLAGLGGQVVRYSAHFDWYLSLILGIAVLVGG